MKNSLYLIVVAVAYLTMISCNKTTVEKDMSEMNSLNIDLEGKTKSSGNIFEESVVLLQSIMPITSANTAGMVEVVLIIEVVTFDDSFSPLLEYYIDSIQYSDDGQYNDEITGDNIFTSIQVFEVDSDFLNRYADIIIVHKSDSFSYDSELERHLIDLQGLEDASVSFGCKVRLAPCPETSWWNTCWPFSSPCTCVEFYDCEFNITL